MHALLYHPLYNRRGFSPLRDSWQRYPQGLALVRELGLLARMALLEPPPASPDELALVHPRRYTDWVRAQEAAGGRRFDGSTPAYPGVFERACASVGATVYGARLIASGRAQTAFNPSGGLHHAHAERASGFCILNDIAVAVRVLQREFGLRRIAVVDLDGHHGDGTQAVLYAEQTLYVSLHRFGGRFYPGTGAASEQGYGAGMGFSLNVPLPRQCGDAAFLLALHRVVAPALLRYGPELIILQYGTDGHYGDVMVRLGLTTHAYADAARLLHHLAERLCAGRLLVTGGGGYRPEDAIRCWALLLAELTDAPPSSVAHLHDDAPYPQPVPGAEDHARETVRCLRATHPLLR